MKNSARRTIVTAAAFVLICFFLPWIQISCLGLRDSVSGHDLAREGDQVLWLIPLLMLLVLLLGLVRLIWQQMPALLALSGMVGGGLSAYLMYRKRLGMGQSSGLIATFWTAWYWLGLVAALCVAASALWFYIKRTRAP